MPLSSHSIPCVQVCLLTTNGPSLSNSEGAGHFRRSSVKHPLQEQLDLKQEQGGYMLPHPIWWVVSTVLASLAEPDISRMEGK